MKTNTTGKEYIARLIPPFASLSMLIMAIAFSPFIALSGITYWILGGLSIATMADYISNKFGRSKLDKFFEDSGFKCNDKYPQIVNQLDTENEITYKIKMPAGMDTDDLEKAKLSIEQYLDTSIRISYDKGYALITAIKKRLEHFYPFELIQTENSLEVCLGYDINGQVIFDLEDAPHLLVAGETGSGKSVCLDSIITSLIVLKDVDLHLIDFQRVSLGIFKKSNKVKTFCTESVEFMKLLIELQKESDKRLELFDKVGVDKISAYNKKTKNKLRYQVVIIDEFASLIDNTPVLNALKIRLAQDRKCGIHYIVSTQRPSRDVIDGTIKCNIPARLAFKTVDDTNSRVILDESGAENLRGKGHGLLKTIGVREFQGFYISTENSIELTKYTFEDKRISQLKSNNKIPVKPPSRKVY